VDNKRGRRRMNTREAILNLQYAEKMKSGLIIGTDLLVQLASLKGDELSGGRKVLSWYLEGLLREVRIAENVLAKAHYEDLERKVMEVIGRVQMSQLQDALRSFSEAISSATTSCQASMSFLVENRLV
jgi:predicted PolB exonuclease-like 3'-5' exonuclease